MTDNGNNERATWLVDDLRVDPGARSVTRDGNAIELPRLSFDLLLTLIEAAPSAVSTDELMDRVWTGRVVSPATVAKRVELLRDALGDDSAEPRYVALVRGYGYRLVPAPRSVDSAERDAQQGPAGTDAPAAAPPRRPWLRPGLAVLASVAVLIAVLAGLGTVMHGEVPDSTKPPERTIAVLPFQSLGDDPEDQLFADGLTDELAHALARTGSLRVTGRSSSFRFRDASPGPIEIGASLGVAHLLEGTVRRSGDRLRVVAQLTDTTDGLQRWTETWEGTMQDALAIQQEIAGQVSRQVAAELGEDRSRGGPASDNAEAYALYLKAVSLMEYPVGSDLPRAQALLERAVALDPGFAAAWVHLGAAHLRRALWNEPTYTLSREESIVAARDAIDRALAADPADGWAYILLGGLAWSFEDDIEKAARLAEQGMRLSAWNPVLENFAADLYRTLGRLEDARSMDERILRRDPLCDRCRQQHVETLNALRDFETAEREARMLLSIAPEHPARVYTLGMTLLRAGKTGEALDTFEQIGDGGVGLAGLAMASHSLGRSEDATRYWEAAESALAGPTGLTTLAKAAAWTGREERALSLLSEALERPHLRLVLQMDYTDPLFDGIRDTAGWRLFLDRLGRSPEQVGAVQLDLAPYLDPDG